MPTDTFTIAASGDDGGGYRERNSWATISSGTFTAADQATQQVSVAHAGYTTYFYVNNCYLRWDTSSIPDDASISAATLKIYVNGTPTNAGARTLEVDWYDFGGNDAVAGDWALTSGSGSAAAGVAYGSSFIGNAVNEVTLTSLSSINKTGYTGVRLALKDTGSPVANVDGFNVASYDNTNGWAAPQLVVTYTTGGGTSTPLLALLGVG